LLGLDGVGGLLLGEGLGRLIAEHPRQGGGGLIAPLVELIGVDAILGGDLTDRAGFPPDFAYDLGLEARAVGFA